MATSRAWSRHASCLGAEIQWYRTRGPSGPLLLFGAVHATQRHVGRSFHGTDDRQGNPNRDPAGTDHPVPRAGRSEAHTSELQSLMRNSYALFCIQKKITPTIT